MTYWLRINFRSTTIYYYENKKIRQGKGKVKLFLCLTKHHAMKTHWGWMYRVTHLISALEGGEWSVSRPGCFTPGKRALEAGWTP
jgi:hypothetical protein